MTIQQPPNDETPTPVPERGPGRAPNDTPDEPAPSAPGPDPPPLSTPRAAAGPGMG